MDLIEMRGYDKLDPMNGFDRQRDQDVEEGAVVVVDQVRRKRTKKKILWMHILIPFPLFLNLIYPSIMRRILSMYHLIRITNKMIFP